MVKDSKDAKRGFVETVELQIGLKNYDPQKDKRFAGTVKLPSVTKAKYKVLVLGDQQHVDEATKAGLECMGLEELKKINKNKKIVKKMGACAFSRVCSQLPRFLETSSLSFSLQRRSTTLSWPPTA